MLVTALHCELVQTSPNQLEGGFVQQFSGVFFAPAFTDNAVLQREPTRATCFGTLIGAEFVALSTRIQLTVTSMRSKTYVVGEDFVRVERINGTYARLCILHRTREGDSQRHAHTGGRRYCVQDAPRTGRTR